ncbi:MAG: hypothetical protein ABIJ47_05060 [Candidatus Bathyarchaeota archaeon]
MKSFIAMLLIAAIISSTPSVARAAPAEVLGGVRLLNVEKVDLASSTYRLDFYLWFSWTPGELTLKQVQDFEFLNGAPSKDIVYVTEEEGFLQYRVKGDFVKTFDFSRYPFESHDLVVSMEHKNLNSSALVYVADADSSVDEGVNVVGWDLLDYETSVRVHRFSGNSFSNLVFSLRVGRPMLSSLVKNVLPITVITVISLLTFFIAPQNFGQRIGLAVSTLMAASAFHISLLNALPPTGYLTLADRMMLTVYIIFLFNLATSVYIMKLVDAKKGEEAVKANKRAAMLLGGLIAVLVALQLLI